MSSQISMSRVPHCDHEVSRRFAVINGGQSSSVTSDGKSEMQKFINMLIFEISLIASYAKKAQQHIADNDSSRVIEMIEMFNKPSNKILEKIQEEKRNQINNNGNRAILHDVGNTVTAILCYVQIAREWYDANEHVKFSELLGKIQECAFSTSLSISEKKNFLGLDSDRSLSQILEIALNLSMPKRRKAGWVRIELDTPSTDVIITKDKIGGYVRLFMNLFNNTFDAFKGRIMKRKTLNVHCSLSENMLKIEVADNAGGILAEEQDKIFQPFFTTKETGTGVGLHFCKQFIERIGGSIWIESSVQAGSTVFYAEIPFL